MKKILFSLSLVLCSGLFAADADVHRDDSQSMAPMADLESMFAQLQIVADMQGKNMDQVRAEFGKDPDLVSIALNAIDEENLPKVRYSVEKLGLNPNATEYHGNTPMEFAALNRNNRILPYLVAQGGDVNLKSKKEHYLGQGLFIKASKAKRVNNMEYLLLQSVDIPKATIKNPEFQTWKNIVLDKLARQAKNSRNPMLIKKHKRLKAKYGLPVEE